MALAKNVLIRYLFAKRSLAHALSLALDDLRNGDVKSASKALDDFWAELDVQEVPAEIGYTLSIQGEWYYALGPRLQTRFKDMLRKYRDLRRAMPRRDSENPPSSNVILMFEGLVADASWVEKVIRKGPDDEFQHGDFTIVPMPGVSVAKQIGCLAALDAAADLLRPKFSQVLYGKVYLAKTLKGGVATYVPDVINLGVKAANTVGDVHALCHEFGHRYYHRFWSNAEQKDRFYHLSVDSLYEEILFDRTTRAKLAGELLDIADKMRAGERPKGSSDLAAKWSGYLNEKHTQEVRPLMRRYVFDKVDSSRQPLWEALARPSETEIRVRTDKIIRGPLVVTPYGAKSWPENFAESFSLYVQGKPIPPEISEIMQNLG